MKAKNKKSLKSGKLTMKQLMQYRKASDRKSVVQGKSVDLGGRRIIKKKKKKTT